MLPTCSALQTSSPSISPKCFIFDCASSVLLPDFRAAAISRVTSVACEDDLALKELLKQCAAELQVDQMKEGNGRARRQL